MKLKFSKMHGTSNDYIYFDGINQNVPTNKDFIINISNRNIGVGGDGIIIILPSKVADFKMRMFNSDGSEGNMCGNGIRCLAKFCYDNKLTTKTILDIETKAGIKNLELLVKDNDVKSVKVNMGKPSLEARVIPVKYHKDKLIDEEVDICGMKYNLTAVSVGNPHAVIFVDNLDFDIAKIGSDFENSSLFPQSVNTEFVKIIDRNNIQMRVWERGSGETLSCGTGSCASMYASFILGKVNNKVKVHVKGGVLSIEILNEYLFMEGSATHVFDGVIEV